MLSPRWLFGAIFAASAATTLADSAFTFSGSTWIWTSEQTSNETLGSRSAPLGSRPFRKTFVTPSGKRAVTANILVTADNTFNLYVNGRSIGSGSDQWQDGRRFDLVPLEGSQNLFSVNATNAENPQDTVGTFNAAGLLVAIQVNYDDESSSMVTSDGSWRTMPSLTPLGFQTTSLDDSSWVTASTFGTYGTFPWSASVAVPQVQPSNTVGGNTIVSSTEKSSTISTSNPTSASSDIPSDTSSHNKATTPGIPFIWVLLSLASTCFYFW